MTQCDQILDHLKTFGSITPLEALSEYGCMRLASRITDLRKDGYPIRREMKTSKNRFGKPVRFAIYYLEGE